MEESQGNANDAIKCQKLSSVLSLRVSGMASGGLASLLGMIVRDWDGRRRYSFARDIAGGSS